METLSTYGQLDFQLLRIGPYALSLIEILVVVFSLLGTYFSRQGWLFILLANCCCFFFFHQIQLYALMAAQAILFVFHLIWGIRARTAEAQAIRKIEGQGLIISVMAILMFSIPLVIVLSQIHDYFPRYFPVPGTFVFLDALIALGSIVATILLTSRYAEAWMFWMILYSLLAFMLGWKGYYLAMIAQMILLGYAAREYLASRSLSSE